MRVAKTWASVRKDAVTRGRLAPDRVKELKDRLIGESHAHKLVEIRRESGLNQEEMAERLNISQSRVSRIERGQLDKAHVATLKAYIEALGGELELSARFGSERVSLG